MASAANGSSSYGDTGKGRVRAGARTSGASELREHDKGEPTRGTQTCYGGTALHKRIQKTPEHYEREKDMDRKAIYGRLHAMGRMGEGGALPSSPKDAKWSTETSWRRRIGALNLGASLTERKEEAGDVE